MLSREQHSKLDELTLEHGGSAEVERLPERFGRSYPLWRVACADGSIHDMREDGASELLLAPTNRR